MKIDAAELPYRTLNERIRAAQGRPVEVSHCLGQRYIASGQRAVRLTLSGTPGNALGSYLDGGSITVLGNAQDAVGDTMSDGSIVIHGSCGDALGYGMRGGQIFVRNDAGYRAGIHMKQREGLSPSIVIGGSAGDFLGEYLAGGCILVLGIGVGKDNPVGSFCGTGMHGGRIFIRSGERPRHLPEQVSAHHATPEQLAEIAPLIEAFLAHFSIDGEALSGGTIWCLSPNSENPYHQLYVPN